MTKFVHDGIESGFLKPTMSGNMVLMNRSGTVNFRLARTKVSIYGHDGKLLVSDSLCQRGVVQAPDGAHLLPYFLKDNVWHVVMVEQFRIAVQDKTLEAAGGEKDEQDARVSMARELEEEIRIAIKPSRIKIAFREFIHPGILTNKIYGGIVKLELHEVPEPVLAGEWRFGEYTVATTRPLIELLRLRDNRDQKLNLFTSRLLDEVAKEVGLLKKHY